VNVMGSVGAPPAVLGKMMSRQNRNVR